ncbi:Serine/threonine-protein kinase PknB [Rubripirellula amarantea]|uniref:non-specific serine/threonine protein kinase n=1 Tax=Rubripirellula amarantea TaxID=2527999 RepID=A0A5C5WEF0_9BACT|nr:serine/threonine-protein kinase [Rubripirellula amarantea]TWT49114.1 Serine/threonine-protein kinase PknB [Rubripirellula amarantea]
MTDTPDTNENDRLKSEIVGPASLVGQRLGDYQILRRLGRGGMAEVFVAKHLQLGRDVALKVLRRELARDEDYVTRFRREARAAAKLTHANIVAVFDVGSIEGWHYMAQEFVDGENLREILERNGPFSADDAIKVLVGVASALEAAAEAGITHRDIKPDNIMRSARGVIKVADFGLARVGIGTDETRADLTQAGLTLGTPRYMSPEQVQGKPVDSRSDLYSLGVTMYHLLAGEPPFTGSDPLALAVKHLHETAEPLDRARNVCDAKGNPDVPEWLIAVVDRLMAKLPDDRYQNPSELLDAVQNETSLSSLAISSPRPVAATIRLQRLADEARRGQRSRIVRRLALLAAPVAAGLITYAWFDREPAISVTDLLRPQTVTRAETVEEQYLIAATRNDEAGWQSVAQYFSDANNSANNEYRIKSQLQLARMYSAEDRSSDALKTLATLLSDPKAGLLYQVLARLEQCRILEANGDNVSLRDAKEQLRAVTSDLIASNPGAKETLRQVVPEADWLRFGIEPS